MKDTNGVDITTPLEFVYTFDCGDKGTELIAISSSEK